MKDFTLRSYRHLCNALNTHGYKFLTFREYCSGHVPVRCIIMRHDVDRNSESALRMATIEHSLSITASYYFRITKGSFDRRIISCITAFNHEVGYHYEDFTLARGNLGEAIWSFKRSIEQFRQLCPVDTICMHGSPLSKWDNRAMWEKYDYREFGLIGEPYFDLKADVLYLTDTGRRWNGANVSIRDRMKSKYEHEYKSTHDIIRAIAHRELPDKLMMNVHPHRWNDKTLPWFEELIWQSVKNVGKRFLIKKQIQSMA